MTSTKKIYAVANQETGLWYYSFDNRKDAEQKAKEMTEYHNKKYIVKEVEG